MPSRRSAPSSPTPWSSWPGSRARTWSSWPAARRARGDAAQSGQGIALRGVGVLALDGEVDRRAEGPDVRGLAAIAGTFVASGAAGTFSVSRVAHGLPNYKNLAVLGTGPGTYRLSTAPLVFHVIDPAR
mgnify:CR=1 FL=1